jgi:hypothetical protein
MKIDVGESLLGSYLRHVRKCFIVQPNWKPSGNWRPVPDHYDQVLGEYDRIQKHPAFTEIFKTSFDLTIGQTEIDLLGLDQEGILYAANVAFNENGISYGPKTDTRNRVIKNLLRAYLALSYYFPGNKLVLMFCSPKVSGPTEDIILNYFKILHSEFNSSMAEFRYYSNNVFRDSILLETLDCSGDEFDTSELFLRSFKLISLFGNDTTEEQTPSEEKEEAAPVEDTTGGVLNAEDFPVPEENEPESDSGQKEQNSPVETEQPREEGMIAATAVTEESGQDEDEKVSKEIKKVKNRVPRWLKRPAQNNSKILIAFLNLMEKSEFVSLEQLAEECKDVANFMGNYAQMINIADKNHGKVFGGTSDKMTLWEPVKEFIIQEYINSKNAFYEKDGQEEIPGA